MNLAVKTGPVASTCDAVARARARRMSTLGIQSVIELCVGPSLSALQHAYSAYKIECTGNDVDMRWTSLGGPWVCGNAMHVGIAGFDAAVFAPPLSNGCTGRREDSLSVDEVTPSFHDFIDRNDTPEFVVLVCPARALATGPDKAQLYRLLSHAWHRFGSVEVIEAKDARGRIRKYTEIWCQQVK